MIVGRPPPPNGPPSQGGGAQHRAAQGERSTFSFAELLAGAERSPGAPGEDLAFSSHGRDFRGSLTVGEDAIRFDARPIVAPVDLPVDRELAAPSTGSAQHVPVTAGLEQPGLRPDGILSAFRLPLSAQAVGGAASDRADATRGAARSRHLGAAAMTPLPGASAGRSSVATDAASQHGGASRAARAARGATAAEVRPPASVVLSPQEVLVVVHGIALSPGERKALLLDVRELLAAHGLGDRAIRLRMDGGRNR